MNLTPTDWSFFLAALNIVFIDVLLAGDNAVLIALAVRNLSPRDRRIGIMAGAAGAVVLRIAFTWCATWLLAVPLLKAVGGVLILWIAVKLLREEGNGDTGDRAAPPSLMHAVWLILVADLTMSLDNILAVAGASHGHVGLIVFGLALSIPFVVFASGWLSGLMGRYPWIVVLGAAILGKVGAEMVITDPWVDPAFFAPWARIVVEGAAAGLVVLIGRRSWRG